MYLKENKFLKEVSRVSVIMDIYYRIGKPILPKWVLDTLMERKENYGDLHKIEYRPARTG